MDPTVAISCQLPRIDAFRLCLEHRHSSNVRTSRLPPIVTVPINWLELGSAAMASVSGLAARTMEYLEPNSVRHRERVPAHRTGSTAADVDALRAASRSFPAGSDTMGVRTAPGNGLG